MHADLGTKLALLEQCTQRQPLCIEIAEVTPSVEQDQPKMTSQLGLGKQQNVKLR
jgi:hypothetical protein